MAGIEKQAIESIRGRSIALTKAFGMQTTLPAGEIILLPNIATQLIDVTPIYNQLVRDKERLEAKWQDIAGKKTQLIGDTELFVLDFLKVLKITVNRSVKLKDGKWSASDLSYYSLDETGGNLPVNLTESEVLSWAGSIKSGEEDRLLDKPTAPAMTNPTVAEVTTAADEAKPLIPATRQALALLNDKRTELDNANPDVDVLLESIWDLVEVRYKTSTKERQREMLRSWGVVYGTVGDPNTLTVLVKDSAGAPLEGADVVLLETEGSASANPEGRVSLETRTVGNITLRFSYPGKADKDVPVSIADDAEGTAIDLGIVVLEA